MPALCVSVLFGRSVGVGGVCKTAGARLQVDAVATWLLLGRARLGVSDVTMSDGWCSLSVGSDSDGGDLDLGSKVASECQTGWTKALLIFTLPSSACSAS